MTHIVDPDPFDTSAALSVLDGMASRADAAPLSSVTSAWESAWIACLTNSPTWAKVSAVEFAHVVNELRGIIWVGRRFEPQPST